MVHKSCNVDLLAHLIKRKYYNHMAAQNLSFGFFDNLGRNELKGKLAWLEKSKDPYTYYDLFGDPKEVPASGITTPAANMAQTLQQRKMSKRDFNSTCRRIFLLYIPPAEGQLLRPHYRDFIARNENRSPEERFLLAETLSQYDFSKTGNFKPHFNREKEFLTVAKLQQIEKKALK